MGWLSTHRTFRGGLLVAAGVLTGLVLLAFILVGVDRITGAAGDADPSTAPSPTPVDRASPPASTVSPVRPSPESGDPASDDRPVGGVLPALPDTDDPDIYAAAVAEVLFGMDYTSHGPKDYEAFFEAALWDELTDDARAGVAATMGMRIPSPDMWDQMRSVEQTSTFEVELVWKPRAQAELDADPGVPDGVAMRNVTGTQTETWLGADGQQQTSARPVTVSLAVVCPPAASPCVLGGIFPNVES